MNSKKQNRKSFLTISAIFMALIMIFALCSCGSDDSGDKKTESAETAAESSENQNSEKEEEQTETEDEPVDKIDLEGLDRIESKDTSKVKIVKKEIVRDAVSGMALRGGDALYFTVENGDSAEVTEFTIYVVGYTNNKGLTEVQPYFQTAIGSVKYVQRLNVTDKTIAAGSSEKIGAEVDADLFSNVRAIVASYKTADGEEYDNPIANEWVHSVQLG